MVKKLVENEPEQPKKKKVQNRGIIRRQRVEMIRKKLPKLLTFNNDQVSEAVKCIKQLKTQNNDLLDVGDSFVYLEIVLNRVPNRFTIRPVQIPLPVPIYSQEMNSKFCIFCKNPQRQFKNKIADLNIPLIQRVIGYSKIHKKFPTYADRRKLFYEYDMFFCDKDIYNLMAQSTGKIFYERKKIPYPIDGEIVPKEITKQIGSDSYEDYLNSLSKYTYFIQGNGPVYTLKIGRIGFSEDELMKNTLQGALNVLPYLLYEPGMNLAALRSMSLKLSNSISVPFFNRLSEREIEVWLNKQKQ